MSVMISWLLSTSVGRIAGTAVVAALLSGLLYAGCQVRACQNHKAEVRAKVAEQTLKIKEQDNEAKKQINDMSNDDLAEYLRSGRLQPGKTGKSTSE